MSNVSGVSGSLPKPGRSRKRTSGARAVEGVPVKVGLAVTGTAAAAIGVIAVVVVAIVWDLSRVPVGEPASRTRPGAHGRPHFEGRIIDLGQVIPLMGVLVLVSIVVVGLVAWWVTRRANAPLQRALEVQEAFVADASHELRTPLATLNGRIQLAQFRYERGGDVQRALADAREDAEVLDGILTDLLTAAEAAALPRPQQYVRLEPAVAAATRLTDARAREADVALVTSVPVGAEVRGETTALTRVFVALLDNALGYSPAGGSIGISACQGGAKYLDIRVSDSGTGIMGANPDRLFERFARENNGGSRRGFGLGLSLVRDVVQRYGGTVAIESTSAEGTTFLVRLPGRIVA